MEFVNVVRSLGIGKKHSHHNDDLFVDRLNHKYTVVIILLFAVVVSASQYAGDPISCWVPGHFTGVYNTYTEKICWVSSTYNIPLNEEIPNDESDRKVKILKYYQWTAFILLFQALLFYLPRMIWRSLNDKSGLDIQSIVDAVYNCYSNQSKFGDRDKLVNYITNSFDFYLNSVKTERRDNLLYVKNEEDLNSARRRNIYAEKRGVNEENDDGQYETQELTNDSSEYENPKPKNFFTHILYFFKVCCITKGKRYGNYLLVLFVVVKLLYTVNSIMQLFILNHFLGNDFLLLGIEVINKIWNGEDWTQLKRFPRVTMCDFRIREVGIVHRYTVQCVLSINLFNEKIFIFLWFWLCLVSLFNLIDLVSWSYTLIIRGQERDSYIKKHLSILNSPTYNARNPINFADSHDRLLFKKFVNSYLRDDVLLALHLLSRNSQDLIVSEIIANMYSLYKAKNRPSSAERSFNPTNRSIVRDVDETNLDANTLNLYSKEKKMNS